MIRQGGLEQQLGMSLRGYNREMDSLRIKMTVIAHPFIDRIVGAEQDNGQRRRRNKDMEAAVMSSIMTDWKKGQERAREQSRARKVSGQDGTGTTRTAPKRPPLRSQSAGGLCPRCGSAEPQPPWARLPGS
jgi:hypothetical protein